MTHRMASLNLIPYLLRPSQSHPRGNANVHPWLPQRISPLQNNLEMATSQIRTSAKRRRRPRILPFKLLHIPRALATSHLTHPQHNKFLIFLRCQSLYLFALYHDHHSHPYGAGSILRVFLIVSFRSLLIPLALQLPAIHNHPPNHKATLSALS